MPLVSPTADFCARPRVNLKPGRYRLNDEREPGYIEAVTDTGGAVELEPGETIKIISSQLEGITFGGDGRAISLLDSELVECDLSGLRIESMSGSRLVRCKIVGTEFAGSAVRDSELVRCSGRYVDFRQARLKRVVFDDCELVEVDCFEARLEDVSFGQCRMPKTNVDRVDGERVDVRGSDVELLNVTRLDGWLVDPIQLPSMMYTLAFALGLSVEGEPAES